MQAYFVISKLDIKQEGASKQIKSGTIYIPDARIQIIPRNGTYPGIARLDAEEFQVVCANPTTCREIEYSKKDLAAIRKAQRVQDKTRRTIDAIVNRGWKDLRQG